MSGKAADGGRVARMQAGEWEKNVGAKHLGASDGTTAKPSHRLGEAARYGEGIHMRLPISWVGKFVE